MLHHETATLPMEIYLKQLRMQYAKTSHSKPTQSTIDKACQRITQTQRGRAIHRTSQKQRDIAEWDQAQPCSTNKAVQEEAKRRAFQEWEATWAPQTRLPNNQEEPPANPRAWKAAHFYTDKEGRAKMNFKGTPSEIHNNLKRAQSSIAIQIRSEHIGFNSYLHRRKVPGIDSPRCQCGYSSQNVKHMIMCCPQ